MSGVKNEVKNEGKTCWSKCCEQQGMCSYCGIGLCCRKKSLFWSDTSNGCDGSIGGNWDHTCVGMYADI